MTKKKALFNLPLISHYSSRREWEEVSWQKIVKSANLKLLITAYERHNLVMRSWRLRRMYPIYVESALSVVWSLVFLGITLFWCLSWALGHAPRGGSPIPNLWGLILVTLALLQLGCGVLLDRQYEPGITRDFFVSILYPSFYWALLAATSCLYTVRGLWRKPNLYAPTRWRIEHAYEDD